VSCGCAAEAGTISFHTTKLLSPAAIESSLQKLAHLVNSFDTSRFERAPVGSLQQMKLEWRASLAGTQWLKGVRQLLETTSEIVNLIIDGEPVRGQTPCWHKQGFELT
jgi:hypothetical protein